MSKTWVTSDLHLGHANILTFKNYDGTPVRPFSSLDEMHGALIENWNDRIADGDRVYVLGDVAMNKRGLQLVHMLKGRKVLVRGNHDMEKLSVYAQFFQDVRGVVAKKGFVMTHVPIHPGSLERWGLNIHGHLHNNTVGDPRYVNVSVERSAFAPVDLQDILDGRFK